MTTDVDHGNVSAWCGAISVKVIIRGTDANPVIEIRSGGWPVGGIEVKRRMERHCEDNLCHVWSPPA